MVKKEILEIFDAMENDLKSNEKKVCIATGGCNEQYYQNIVIDAETVFNIVSLGRKMIKKINI